MERKIGEIFEHNGEWSQCIIGNGCGNCAFNERRNKWKVIDGYLYCLDCYEYSEETDEYKPKRKY